jgi:hypothetical protein
MGIGVAERRAGQREELIFNRHTGALIGTQSTLVNPAYPGLQAFHLRSGARIGSISYVSSGVVGSASALPGGGRVGSPRHRPGKWSATP